MRFQSPSTVPAKRPRGLGVSGSSSDDDGDEDDQDVPPPKRTFARSAFAGGVTKKPSQAGDAPVKPNSFAAKMMAKMGHVAGQGLGREGQGILNPVDTKLRPQGAGLGAVREKTQQAKNEERRTAEAKGEQLEDSSEEERRKRQREKKSKRSQGGSGTSTPGGFTRAKTKYRTAEEIEKSASGLEVPNVLKSIIDATGKETRLLSSTSGLMTGFTGASAPISDAERIAKRARRDLEAFAEEWSGLTDRKKYTDDEEEQLEQEIAERRRGIQRAQTLVSAVEQLQGASHWEETMERLDRLGAEFEGETESYGLSEIAVAAIQPLFKTEMESWDPLERPEHLVPYFQRLRSILNIHPVIDIDALTITNGLAKHYYSKSTTAFETLIYTLWFPRVRSSIVNDWEVDNPSPVLELLDAWRPILPPFIYFNLIESQILPKLTQALIAWNPRTSKKHHRQASSSTNPPHVWLFPWLPHLPSHHLDATSSTGLLADMKRALRTHLARWDLSSSQVLPGIDHYSTILPEHLPPLMIRHLLPRLSSHLQSNLDVWPPDQDLAALNQVMIWEPYFKTSTMAELLVAIFFPKWQARLHEWLVSPTVDHEQVAQWYEWWKRQFSEAVNATPAVAREWERGIEMMSQALDLGDRVATDLPQPALPTPIPSSSEAIENVPPPAAHPRPNAIPVEATFRDVVEEWSSDENLLFIPLHEAHKTTGLPLFRLTASANGKGGVLVYLKGDVVWAQNKKDRDLWEPTSLNNLMGRAAGK
jgi:tuftelin-interacting protein 11